MMKLSALTFCATAIGLLFSPIVFLKSFENNLVQNYAPTIIKQKASGEYREWMYYTYANEKHYPAPSSATALDHRKIFLL